MQADSSLRILVLVTLPFVHMPRAAMAQCSEQRLSPTSISQGAGFGASVCGLDDFAVVGAPLDDELGADSGAAYVFRHDFVSGIWQEQQKLVASDGTPGDALGTTVCADGSVIAIGAPFDADLGFKSGSAYLYRRDHASGLWQEEQKLLPSDGEAKDLFGKALGATGSVVLVGAPYDDDLGSSSGSVYVFQLDPLSGLWLESQKLLAGDGAPDDNFGHSICAVGNCAVIGSPGDDDLGSFSGSVYVFQRDPLSGLWEESQKLLASDGTQGDGFGHSVSCDRELLAVGAPTDDQVGFWEGSVYVFAEASSTWSQQTKIPYPDPSGIGVLFGWSLAVAGNSLVVGAPFSCASPNCQTGPDYGAVYTFANNQTGWHLQDRITPATPQASAVYGLSASMHGTTLVIGAPGYSAAGSSFVYAIDMPIVYCTPKLNSLGCIPSVASSGTPCLSGSDDFHITAASVLNNKVGIMIWSGAPNSLPFMGGILCLAPPIIRTPHQISGGNPPPLDCSGTYSFHFSQAYMASKLIPAGTQLYAQYWSRDPGFAPPNNVGLTDGLEFVVGP